VIFCPQPPKGGLIHSVLKPPSGIQWDSGGNYNPNKNFTSRVILLNQSIIVMTDLKGKRVAILATSGFEESELFEPLKALKDNGAEVFIVSPEFDKIKAWTHGNWSREIDVDVSIEDADANEFDALVIPGGVINPDKLRREQKAVEFVRYFFDKNKFVASICHGPQMLIEAEVVKGRTLTSFSSIKKDLINAGAYWIDRDFVLDNNLLTSRSPEDLSAFNKKLIEEVAKVEMAVK
jgi:protease I